MERTIHEVIIEYEPVFELELLGHKLGIYARTEKWKEKTKN